MEFSATTGFDRLEYGINNLQPLIEYEVILQIDAEFVKNVTRPLNDVKQE